MKKLLLGSGLALASFASTATIVEMNTSQGTIEINLFDQQTPKTVENFLSYVQDESYNETVIHRSVADFVIQGGGFTYSDSFDAIDTKPTVENEPVFSNVKGTIAMAKLSGDEDSATSQWFFNISDNSAALDTQNGGFTVFGKITAASQSTLDKIAALVHCGEVPVVDITEQQCSSSDVSINSANLVTIQSVVVMDDDPKSAAGLSVTTNTSLDSGDTSTDSGSSSGGSLAWLLGGVLLVFTRLKRFK